MADAFGHALYDAWRGEDAHELIERDDGYIRGGPGASQYLAPYRNWPRHERHAMRYARGRVLDVGCGAGRVALHLKDRGLDVTGIDISPLAIRVCRLRGLRKAKVLALERVTPALGRFDTVLMLGANLGLLRSKDHAPRLLERLARVTDPAARIIGSTIDPYRTRVAEHLAYHARNRRRGRMGGQVRLRVRYRALATSWSDYLFMSKRELRQLLAGTEWRVVRTIDAASGPAYVAVIERR